MKGTLHKTDKGWVVIHFQATLNGPLFQSLPLHPDETNMDVLNPSPEGKEVEFEIVKEEDPGPKGWGGLTIEYARILEPKEPLSILELNNLYGDILLEYSKYLEDHGFLDTDWRYEANGENTVEDFINSKKK